MDSVLPESVLNGRWSVEHVAKNLSRQLIDWVQIQDVTKPILSLRALTPATWWRTLQRLGLTKLYQNSLIPITTQTNPGRNKDPNIINVQSASRRVLSSEIFMPPGCRLTFVVNGYSGQRYERHWQCRGGMDKRFRKWIWLGTQLIG